MERDAGGLSHGQVIEQLVLCLLLQPAIFLVATGYAAVDIKL